MRRPVWATLAALAPAAGAGANDHTHAGRGSAHPGLERLKKLAGEWVALDDKGKPTDQAAFVFKVTAGGAGHETIFPGAPREMVSVYHTDGKDLVLDYDCATGNRPRTRADPTGKPNERKFVFPRGRARTRPGHAHARGVDLPDRRPHRVDLVRVQQRQAGR